jgi:hypothetical protein
VREAKGHGREFQAAARFRAKLIVAKKSDKRINNILAVLSKALTTLSKPRSSPARHP